MLNLLILYLTTLQTRIVVQNEALNYTIELKRPFSSANPPKTSLGAFYMSYRGQEIRLDATVFLNSVLYGKAFENQAVLSCERAFLNPKTNFVKNSHKEYLINHPDVFVTRGLSSYWTTFMIMRKKDLNKHHTNKYWIVAKNLRWTLSVHLSGSYLVANNANDLSNTLQLLLSIRPGYNEENRQKSIWSSK